MIITLDMVDERTIVCVGDNNDFVDAPFVDPAAQAETTYKEEVFVLYSLFSFITLYPDMPTIAGIRTASYEPDNNLYHVQYVSGEVDGFPIPKGHALIEWFHNNKDVIYQKARESKLIN